MVIEKDRHSDLLYIKQRYSNEVGVEFTQAQALKKVLLDTANRLRNEEGAGHNDTK